MRPITKRYIFCLPALLAFLTIGLNAAAQNALPDYTGTYKRTVKGYHATVTVYVKDNKLQAKQSWDGKVRTFEPVGNNRFIIAMDGWAIEFIKDARNRVMQMKVLGSEVWVKEG